MRDVMEAARAGLKRLADFDDDCVPVAKVRRIIVSESDSESDAVDVACSRACAPARTVAARADPVGDSAPALKLPIAPTILDAKEFETLLGMVRESPVPAAEAPAAEAEALAPMEILSEPTVAAAEAQAPPPLPTPLPLVIASEPAAALAGSTKTMDDLLNVSVAVTGHALSDEQAAALARISGTRKNTVVVIGTGGGKTWVGALAALHEASRVDPETGLAGVAVVVTKVPLYGYWLAELGRFAGAFPGAQVIDTRKSRLDFQRNDGRADWHSQVFETRGAVYVVTLSEASTKRNFAEAFPQPVNLLIADEFELRRKEAIKAQQVDGLRAWQKVMLTATPCPTTVSDLMALANFVAPYGHHKLACDTDREDISSVYRILSDAMVFGPGGLPTTPQCYLVSGKTELNEEAKRANMAFTMTIVDELARKDQADVALARAIWARGEAKRQYQPDDVVRQQAEEVKVARATVREAVEALRAANSTFDDTNFQSESVLSAMAGVLTRERELLPPGRTRLRGAIFVHFVKHRALLLRKLDEMQFAYTEYKTGNAQDQEGARQKFESGEVELIIVSMTVGGAGLNLPSGEFTLALAHVRNCATNLWQPAGRIGRKGGDPNKVPRHYLAFGNGEITNIIADALIGRHRQTSELLQALKDKTDDSETTFTDAWGEMKKGEKDEDDPVSQARLRHTLVLKSNNRGVTMPVQFYESEFV